MEIYEELGLIQVEPSAISTVLDNDEHIFLILEENSNG